MVKLGISKVVDILENFMLELVYRGKSLEEGVVVMKSCWVKILYSGMRYEIILR